MTNERLNISWKTTSAGLGIVSISLTATLVTVVSIQNVDLLSTVALSLAIITFVAQLLIFIAQNWDSTEQSHRSLTLHTETQTVLSEIRARASGSETILREQVSRFMNYLISPKGVESIPDERMGADESHILPPLDTDLVEITDDLEGDIRWIRLHSPPSNPVDAFRRVEGLRALS